MKKTKESLVEDVYGNLSKNLRCLRTLNSLTQETVSEMVHVSRKHYCACENGSAIPSLITLCLLADLYEVRLDTLISAHLREDLLARYAE